MKTKSVVYCTLQVEGTHNWPNCPYDEVDYLRVPHRHMFHIKAYKPVTHSDRDVEFIMLKHRIESYLLTSYGKPIMGDHNWEICDNKMICVFGAMSCEMIAEELIEKFGLSKCEVNEDNENGAIVEVTEVEEKTGCGGNCGGCSSKIPTLHQIQEPEVEGDQCNIKDPTANEWQMKRFINNLKGN